jgi:hypothetical protein
MYQIVHSMDFSVYEMFTEFSATIFLMARMGKINEN